MGEISFFDQAKIIALIEIASSIIGFLFVSGCTLLLWSRPDLRNEILQDEPDSFLNIILHFSMPEKVTSVAVPIIYFVGEFALALFLYRSVINRNYKHLKVWLHVTITICMTALYFFLPGVFFTDDSSYFISIFLLSYGFTAYSVYCVWRVMKELKSAGLHTPITAWEEDDTTAKL